MSCPYGCHGFPSIAVGQCHARKNQRDASFIERQQLRCGCCLLCGSGSCHLVVGRIASLEFASHSIEGLEFAGNHQEEGRMTHLPEPNELKGAMLSRCLKPDSGWVICHASTHLKNTIRFPSRSSVANSRVPKSVSSTPFSDTG